MQQQQQQPQATVVSVPGQPTNVQYVIATQPPKPLLVFQNFPKKQAIAIGVMLIVSGLLAITFNIIEIAVAIDEADDTNYDIRWLFGFIGHGFWVGIMCIIPGGLGIGAGVYKTRNRICAFNVMCVIGAAFATAQFGIGLAGAIAGPNCYSYWGGNWYYNSCHSDIEALARAMEAVQAGLAVVEAIFAIWGSVICCRTYCCCSCCETSSQPAVHPYATPVTVLTGNPQISTIHYPVTVQGYRNVAYQPGYPGQPVQFTVLPPSYAFQGQFGPAADQPPVYPGVHQSVQPSSPTMFGVMPPVGQFQTPATTVHQSQDVSKLDE